MGSKYHAVVRNGTPHIMRPDSLSVKQARLAAIVVCFGLIAIQPPVDTLAQSQDVIADTESYGRIVGRRIAWHCYRRLAR
jgi:hypothetical protein